MIVPILLVMSLFIVIEPDSFNQVFDGVTLIYLVGVVVALSYYRKSSVAANEELEAAEKRTYTWKKRPKHLTWQQKFAGTWSKIERTGFYEFMLWNGAPSFIASMQKDSNFGQIIQFQPDDDRVVKVDNTGFPSGSGGWVPLGEKEETAKQIDAKDPNGKKLLTKGWYDEEEKAINMKSYNVPDKVWVHQKRYINEDGHLIVSFTNTRDSDGQSISFQSRMKKISN